MRLEQTMRWYGPGNDVVTLRDISQAGATGIVTALHHIPVGEIWPLEEIRERVKIIENQGLRLSVIESVNIHESIKTGLPTRDEYIEKYCKTIENLSAAGVNTICYNFMPVLDWTRTDLAYDMGNGALALRFYFRALVAFDLFMLKRENAEKDYTPEQIEQAEQYFKGLTESEKKQLQGTIMAGIPGTDEVVSNEAFKDYLDIYKDIDRAKLKENLKYFLQAIIPTAEKAGVRLAIHPDDPPFPIMGLPRIVSKKEDLEDILGFVDSQSNGLCFCTGSLGARPDNDLPGMINALGSRINFLHLRNVKLEGDGSFHEDNHLEGSTDMYAVMKAVVEEQVKREKSGRDDSAIPMRPDHGHQMLDDLSKKAHPGYTAIGRLKGLAELRGLEVAIRRNL